MAKSDINIFPFFKQLEAALRPVNLIREIRAILAENLYGAWRVIAGPHENFQREIREDI